MNWIAILITAAILIAISSFWYSEKAFGKKWMKLSGVKPDKKKDMRPIFAGQILATLVMLVVLCTIIILRGEKTFIGGVTTGALLWAGFVATKLAERSLWEGSDWELWAINSSNALVNLCLAGGILAVWH